MKYCQLQTLHEIPICVDQVLSRDLDHVCLERCLDIKLCLFELLSNAILHNPVNGPETNVYVCWQLEDNGIHIDIYRDQPACSLVKRLGVLPEQHNDESLSEHGRGLFLVAALAESFWYSDDFKQMSLTITW